MFGINYPGFVMHARAALFYIVRTGSVHCLLFDH